MRFVQEYPHDRAGDRYVETGIEKHALLYLWLRHAGLHGKRLHLGRVHLHHSKVLRAIAVNVDCARVTTFHRVNRWQPPRWQMVERRNARHAGQKWYCHGRYPLSGAVDPA